MNAAFNLRVLISHGVSWLVSYLVGSVYHACIRHIKISGLRNTAINAMAVQSHLIIVNAGYCVECSVPTE